MNNEEMWLEQKQYEYFLEEQHKRDYEETLAYEEYAKKSDSIMIDDPGTVGWAASREAHKNIDGNKGCSGYLEDNEICKFGFAQNNGCDGGRIVSVTPQCCNEEFCGRVYNETGMPNCCLWKKEVKNNAKIWKEIEK